MMRGERKTPSPTLASRSGAVTPMLERERRSPKSVERTSPTQGKGASSPTEVAKMGAGRAPDAKGGGRSASAAGFYSPTPPANAHPRPQQMRPHTSMTRSKSNTGAGGELLVATEAKMRHNLRRLPIIETRDSVTQTPPELGAPSLAEAAFGPGWADGAWASLPQDISELELGEEAEPAGTSSGWLDQQIRMQGELEMALRSALELNAERRLGVVEGLGPSTAKRAIEPAELSDGECHGEDDEVRSLSLSEDGPVIRRSLSEQFGRRGMRGPAPDPLAMLSDGQHKSLEKQQLLAQTQLRPLALADDPAQPTAATFLRRAASEPRSASEPSSLNEESDRSAAITHVRRPSKDDEIEEERYFSQNAIFEHLTPILSKVAGQHLEVVQEQEGAAAAAQRRCTAPQVKATRVRALRGSSSLESFGLTEERIDALNAIERSVARPQSARSDVSFGSAASAFSPPSSASGSLPGCSPRARTRTLTAAQSLPSLSPTGPRLTPVKPTLPSIGS